MSKQIDKTAKPYKVLIRNIGDLLETGRKKAYQSVNQILVQTYWQIGKYIVEFEQGGKEKAEYGTKLLDKLAKDLTIAYGKGFSRSQVIYIRKLFFMLSQNW